MRFRLPLAFAMPVILLLATSALGAVDDGQPQEKSSLLVWVIMMLPAAFFMVLILAVLRRERKRQTVIDTELDRAEQERRRNQEHRGAVQARLAALDEKLSRAVDLLAAIERGRRTGDS